MLIQKKIILLNFKPDLLELVQNELHTSEYTFIFNFPKTTDDYDLALRQFIPDIIIDGDLPGSQLSCYKDFQTAQNILPNLPFIVISSNLQESTLEILKHPGTELIHPENLKALIPKIGKLLTNSKMECNDELLDLKNEFELVAKTISHDLKAPLRAIESYLKILVEDYGKTFNEDEQHLCNSIGTNAEKLRRQMEDLVIFSRITIREIKYEPIQMQDLIKEVINGIAEKSKHNAEIKIGNLFLIQGDKTLLHLLFFHLIENAVKYSSKKEKPIIEVNSEEQKDGILFSIKDNGIGFDMKYSKKLFEAFERLHDPSEYDGTGMGLAIVQRITKKHHGKVWTEAIPGEGAVFYCLLPKG